MSLFVVGSGQSNAIGGAGGEGGDQTVNENVKIWNGTNWVPATLGVEPFAVTTPPYRNNAFWNFCKKLQEETGETVYFVLSGKGNTPISAWSYPSGTEWIKLNTSVLSALASPELSGKSSPDYFLWFQGENDHANTSYKSDFLEFRNKCILSGWMTNTTKVIAGEIINNNCEAKKALFSLLGDADTSWFDIAPNLNVGVSDSGPHFTGAGYVDYGRGSFYETAIQLPRDTTNKYYKWTPFFDASTSKPTIVYNESGTYGGMAINGNIAHVWFKITMTSMTGGSGALYIKGMPRFPSATIPNNAGFFSSGIAGEVVNTNIANGPVILRVAGGNGIRLFKTNSFGETVSVSVSDITGTTTISGSITYLIN